MEQRKWINLHENGDSYEHINPNVILSASYAYEDSDGLHFVELITIEGQEHQAVFGSDKEAYRFIDRLSGAL